jgi:hypothetical protein
MADELRKQLDTRIQELEAALAEKVPAVLKGPPPTDPQELSDRFETLTSLQGYWGQWGYPDPREPNRRQLEKRIREVNAALDETDEAQNKSAENPPKTAQTTPAEPDTPTTLLSLAAKIRLKNPRRRTVVSFLELVDRKIQKDNPVTIDFDDIREHCHGGSDVEDDTVERTIKEGRREIAGAVLPYQVKQSGHTVVVHKTLV